MPTPRIVMAMANTASLKNTTRPIPRPRSSLGTATHPSDGIRAQARASVARVAPTAGLRRGSRGEWQYGSQQGSGPEDPFPSDTTVSPRLDRYLDAVMAGCEVGDDVEFVVELLAEHWV